MTSKFDAETQARRMRASVSTKTRELDALYARLQKTDQDSPDFRRLCVQHALKEKELSALTAGLEKAEITLTNATIKESCGTGARGFSEESVTRTVNKMKDRINGVAEEKGAQPSREKEDDVTDERLRARLEELKRK